MTAADMYLNALHDWRPKKEQKRLSETERKQEPRGQVIDFVKAKQRMRPD